MLGLLILALGIGGLVFYQRRRRMMGETLPADLTFQIKQTYVAAAQAATPLLLNSLAQLVQSRGFEEAASEIIADGAAFQSAPDWAKIQLAQAVTANDPSLVNQFAGLLDTQGMSGFADYTREVAIYMAERNLLTPPVVTSGY